jgi:hypothetical protein
MGLVQDDECFVVESRARTGRLDTIYDRHYAHDFDDTMH